jgi:hypothetical protein
MIELIEILKWPIVVVVLGVVFLITQIVPIGNLIRRIIKLPLGVEAEKQIPQQEKVDEKKSPVDELIHKHVEAGKTLTAEELIRQLEESYLARSIDFKLRVDFEQMLLSELGKNQISDEDSLKFLVKYSALITYANSFEYLYTNIFGSQLRILQHLNGLHDGESSTIIYGVFYEPTAKANELIYKNYTFSNYISFLERNELISQREQRI